MNETLGLILPDIQYETPQDIVAAQQMRETPLGEYLGAKTGEGFDMSIPGMMSQEQRILNKELDDPRLGYEKQMSREDWDASPWQRKGIEWNDEFTPARAQVIAEDFDAREYRKSLVERSPFGMRSVLGFGAAMVGSALDPVNYLPLFGPAAKAKAVMRLGEIGGRAAMSAAEAGIQTGITDLAVFDRLNKQGEDLGWLDGALDVTFGAAIGGLFGAGSGALHKMRVESTRRRLPMPMREEFGRAMEKALADQAAGKPVDVSEVLQTFSRNADLFKTLADGTDAEVSSPVKDTIRDGLMGREDFSPDQVDTYFKVTDAAARSWGETYGRDPADWYGEVLGGMEPHALDVGGSVGERLNQGKILPGDLTTPEFKAWFGDSKVVDERGKPLVLYHGTHIDTPPIDEFKTGHEYQRVEGAYFSKDPKEASKYTKTAGKQTGVVYPVVLALKNPATSQALDELGYKLNGREMRDALIKKGYDGVIDDTMNEVIVFDPKQVKSVHNRGTWGPNDPNILHQGGAGVKGTVTERLSQGKITPGDVSTPEFKRWFGESKAVDERGKPLVVYHGTVADFDTFEKGDIGFHVGTESQASQRAEDLQYFDGKRLKGKNARVMPVYLNIRNPLRLPDVTNWDFPTWTADELLKKGMIDEKEYDRIGYLGKDDALKELKRKIQLFGYDGIVYRNQHEGIKTGKKELEDSYIAFSPNQIKSIWNRGTWSKTDPNILKQAGTKGSVTFNESNRAFVELFKTADFSTLVHETGHILRRTLSGADKATVESAFKVADGTWTREAEEAFAGAFERYLTEGVSPTKALQSVFDKIASWMLAIYKTLKNAGEDIPEDVRGVFDRLLSTEQERKIDFGTERTHDIPEEMVKANPAGPDESPVIEAMKKTTEPKPGEAKGATAFEAGLLPEEADAIQRASHPDDIQAMTEASRFTETMDKYADAYLAAADCIMG